MKQRKLWIAVQLVYAIFSRIPSSSMVNIRISKTYSEGDWLFSVSSTRYFMARDLLSFLQEEGKEGLFIVSPYGESLEEQQMYNYMEEIVTACGYRFLNMNTS